MSGASRTPRTPGSASWLYATLVQGYSAFIYEGPFYARAIHKGLAARLAASPYATLAEAVGAETRKATA